MLSDYANVIAPVIAIINSVIAVSSSHFKPEKQRLKIALLVASIALVAAARTIYGQYIVVTKQTAEANNRKEIHKRLGELIAQGDALLFILRDPPKPLPSDDVKAWAMLAEQYLNDTLGPGFVERFRDSS